MHDEHPVLLGRNKKLHFVLKKKLTSYSKISKIHFTATILCDGKSFSQFKNLFS